MLNHIALMGRLVRDPELKYTRDNTAVCTVTLAVERDYARQGEKREADFIDVVCWRGTAEFVAKWFRKGQLVACDGRLQSRTWRDRHDQSRVSFEVVADNVYFAEHVERREQSAPTYAYQAGGKPADPAAPLFDQIDRAGGLPVSDFAGMADDEDDVPF